MAKIIKYKLKSGENLIDAFFECKTQAQFDANYPIVESEAVPSTIKVSGEFDPEQENADLTTEQRVAELEEALMLLLSGVTE